MDPLISYAGQDAALVNIERLAMAVERLAVAIEDIRDVMLEELEEDESEDGASPT